jgi:hypothetical protein
MDDCVLSGVPLEYSGERRETKKLMVDTNRLLY